MSKIVWPHGRKVALVAYVVVCLAMGGLSAFAGALATTLRWQLTLLVLMLVYIPLGLVLTILVFGPHPCEGEENKT